MLTACLAAAVRADTVNARCDIYPKGSDRASASLACSFSQRQGHVRIQRSDGVSYELRPVGGGPGRYVDAQGRPAVRQRGLGSRGQIYRLAAESVFVYWDAAGLPGRSGMPAIQAAPGVLPPAAPPPVPLDRTLSLLGVSFRLSSANNGSLNALQIVPSGATIDNTPIVLSVDGQIVGAEVADLDADGSPELYVYVSSAGSGSYGSLVAYGVNKGRSFNAIAMPALSDTPGADMGYMGHDQFAVVEGRLARRFPVYGDGDPNAAPSGGVRQLQYRLDAGQAGWRLVVDRVVHY